MTALREVNSGDVIVKAMLLGFLRTALRSATAEAVGFFCHFGEHHFLNAMANCPCVSECSSPQSDCFWQIV